MVTVVIVVFVFLCLWGALRNIVSALASLVGLILGLLLLVAAVKLSWDLFLWLLPYLLWALVGLLVLTIVCRIYDKSKHQNSSSISTYRPSRRAEPSCVQEIMDHREEEELRDWVEKQSLDLNITFPDREPNEPPATKRQIEYIRHLVRSIDEETLEDLGNFVSRVKIHA